LPEQSSLESLVLLLQQRDELLVLVALMLCSRNLRAELFLNSS